MAREINTIHVDGMSCGHCANTVKKAVGALNGVFLVEVDLEKKKVLVEYDDEKASIDTIKGTIEDQGYKVR